MLTNVYNNIWADSMRGLTGEKVCLVINNCNLAYKFTLSLSIQLQSQQSSHLMYIQPALSQGYLSVQG